MSHSSGHNSDPIAFGPRVDALRERGILDTPPEERFNRLAELAAYVFDIPTGVVSFIDETREWMKARQNFDRRELPLDVAFGAETIKSDDLVVVEDANSDNRFRSNPLVTGSPGLRFYAGAPLRVEENLCIGTVAVMDTTPRSPSSEALNQLQTLATLVVERLNDRNRPEDEDLIDALLSSSSANAVVLDEDGKILRTNQNWDAFAQENGLNDVSSVGEGINYLDALDPSPDTADDDTTRRARDGLERVLRGKTDTFELVYPCHSPKEKRWFEMRVRRLDHSRARALVSHRNVTDRRWKRRRRRILETAVEHAREAVLITKGEPVDHSGPPITYVNPAFTEMTGYEFDEVIGRPPGLLRGPNTETWVLRKIQKHLERGAPFEAEAINYRKDGTPFINQWASAPVRDEEGAVTHWVSFQRDVTEERHMERRLLEAQERERRRIAEEMHHDMGGLLTSLQMATSHIQSQSDDASSSVAGLEQVVSIADELSDVVRTLTERLHSRILDDYGLSEALSRMATDFQERHGLIVEVYNEIPNGERLPSLIEKISYRAVYEALRNVTEHAQTDRAELLLHVEAKALRIHVLDDGAGFEPSQELARAHHGLVAIKKRVDRMNGRLEINSIPDEGTRVTITLPLSIPPFRG